VRVNRRGVVNFRPIRLGSFAFGDSESDYGDKFSKADFAGLATVLSKIKGRFILSVNDVPETREFFARFSIEGVTTHYSIGGGEGIEAEEIIVMGTIAGGSAALPE
jgi:hypothetical protein